MKKFLLILLMSVALISAACGNEKSAPVKITPDEAKMKLAEFNKVFAIYEFFNSVKVVN